MKTLSDTATCDSNSASSGTDFHLAEYACLREEILHHMTANNTLERESTVGTVAIYAWVLTRPDNSLSPLLEYFILILPVFLNFFNWFRARAHGRQIGYVGRYIFSLEKYYGQTIAMEDKPIKSTEDSYDKSDIRSYEVFGWEQLFRIFRQEVNLKDNFVEKRFLNLARNADYRWYFLIIFSLVVPSLLATRELFCTK